MIELFTWLGIIWACVIVLRLFLRLADENQRLERFKEEADRRIRVVQLEKLPDQQTILAYDSENNQFLGQGKDVNEVKARIMERFPEKVFILGDKVFSGLKGNIEVQLEKSITG